MPFYQNPFEDEFRGSWILGDRQHALTFKCPGNAGRGNDTIYAWNAENYDTTGTDNDGVNNNELTIRYAHGPELSLWHSFTVSLTDSSAVSASQIVSDLNDNATFANEFEASVIDDKTSNAGPVYHVSIRAIKRRQTMLRFFVENNGAETKLRFNARSGVAELPFYFDRHAVDEVLNFTDGTGMLIPLGHRIESVTQASPGVITSTAHGLSNSQQILIANSDTDATLDGTRTVAGAATNTFNVGVNTSTAGGTRGVWMTLVERDVINNAVDYRGNSQNHTAASVQEDYELLNGRSGIFTFQNITVDGSDRITQIIEYPAGAGTDDMGRLIKYTYTSSNTKPDTITEEPYVLLSGDLITP